MTDEKQTGVIDEKPVFFKRVTDTVPGSVVTDEQKEKATIEAENEKKEDDKVKKRSSL